MTRLTQFSCTRTIVLLLATGLAAFGQSAEDIRLTVGKSIVIDYPADIRQISFSNPDVVDATAVTTREILIHGKAYGTVTLIVWSKAGQRTFYNITVETNMEPLRRLLRDSFPNETIQVQSSRDSVSLTGRVSGPAVSERATTLAAAFGKNIVNNLQIAVGPIDKQIMLRVKYAELNRSTESDLGVSFISTGAGNTIGRVTTGAFTPPSPQTIQGTSGSSNPGTNTTFTISDALNIFAFRPDLNLGAFIKALQTRNVLQILAEPNLITTNGKEAHFLVGGEFPIPILQGGANAGAVTIQFKEFGIRLSFTPWITENKTIKMLVKPEVSTIDLANSLIFNGFRIPALSTRRVETNIELAEGQSFVLGGLIDDRETETFAKLPGLSSIPVLGALFKSKTDSKARTELIVIVTPEITKPLDPNEPKPAITFPNTFLVPLQASAAHDPKPVVVKHKLFGKFHRSSPADGAGAPDAPAANPPAANPPAANQPAATDPAAVPAVSTEVISPAAISPAALSPATKEAVAVPVSATDTKDAKDDKPQVN